MKCLASLLIKFKKYAGLEKQSIVKSKKIYTSENDNTIDPQFLDEFDNHPK